MGAVSRQVTALVFPSVPCVAALSRVVEKGPQGWPVSALETWTPLAPGSHTGSQPGRPHPSPRKKPTDPWRKRPGPTAVLPSKAQRPERWTGLGRSVQGRQCEGFCITDISLCYFKKRSPKKSAASCPPPFAHGDRQASQHMWVPVGCSPLFRGL